LISNEDFSADCEAIYGEHCIDIAGVTGSIPVVPTIFFSKNNAIDINWHFSIPQQIKLSLVCHNDRGFVMATYRKRFCRKILPRLSLSWRFPYAYVMVKILGHVK
jgi:hypothetical protein